MITGLSNVATSGSYNDLSNKPTIPAAYTHPTPSGLGGAKSSGLYKISTDANGHVTGTASVSEFDLPQHTHYDMVYLTQPLIEDLQGDLSANNFAEFCESEEISLDPTYKYVIRNISGDRFCTYVYNSNPAVDNWVLLNDSNPFADTIMNHIRTTQIVVTYTDDSTETLYVLTKKIETQIVNVNYSTLNGKAYGYLQDIDNNPLSGKTVYESIGNGTATTDNNGYFVVSSSTFPSSIVIVFDGDDTYDGCTVTIEDSSVPSGGSTTPGGKD